MAVKNTSFRLVVAPGWPVLRLDSTLPDRFVSEHYDRQLIKLLASAFNVLLVEANARGDNAWQRRVASLEKFSLTELCIPCVHEGATFEVITSAEDGTEQRRCLEIAPIAAGIRCVPFAVDRSIMFDSERRHQVCGILAYILCLRILPHCQRSQLAVLLQLDAADLASYLDSHVRYQLSAASLGRWILRRLINAILDQSS
ncbi:hypothetical protein KBI23_13900 [bacterium]|nr:hypothetical protein [bacterium]